VIKDKCRHINEAAASGYILGYTCLNDVTARDLQSRDSQWTRSKSFDTFCPVGPWIETAIDPARVKVESYLNGGLKQSSDTGNLIFSAAKLVSFVSGVMTLLPGDIISTGTPYGVGPMLPGDEIEIRIEGIGSLRNRIVGEK
jgi:2-keto-4-pentenoate hydratase/2-oxohepta-3-ene-1,7-dioic acid hydratase in catechol pathway